MKLYEHCYDASRITFILAFAVPMILTIFIDTIQTKAVNGEIENYRKILNLKNISTLTSSDSGGGGGGGGNQKNENSRKFSIKKRRYLRRNNRSGRGYLERCAIGGESFNNTTNSNGESITSMSKTTKTTTSAPQLLCANFYVCFQSICRCPLGHAYPLTNSDDYRNNRQFKSSLTSYSNSTPVACVKFGNFRCQADTQCQDVDANVICQNNSKTCRCRAGYFVDNETGYCKKAFDKYKASIPTRAISRVLKFKERSSSSSSSSSIINDQLASSSSSSSVLTMSTAITNRQLFMNNAKCKHNKDCTGAPYIYCHRGRCKCWPEFQFLPDETATESAIFFSQNDTATRTSTATNIDNSSNNNQANSSIIVNDDIWRSESPSTPAQRILERGYCVRKLCQSDDQCRTFDNQHLVCNNTICECRYNYVMTTDTKICRRQQYRRQSCDLTCRIIGGVFASIFLLTLIYWCFYCCFSVIKSYRNRRLTAVYEQQHHHLRRHRLSHHNHHHNHHDPYRQSGFEPIDYQRYLSQNSLARNLQNSRRSSQAGSSIFTGGLSTFLRFSQFNDDPPSYAQAMINETLPDYDAVMELRPLRKNSNSESKPE